MGYSVRRWRDELRSIEKQLPLFRQKISELEKRQSDLKAWLKEEEREREPAAVSAPVSEAPVRRRYAQLSLPAPKVPAFPLPETATTEPEPKKTPFPFSVLAKDNVFGVLGEVNHRLRFLNQVVGKAVNNVETLMLIINFLEQSGGDLQKQLYDIAEKVRLQMENPPAANSTPDAGASPEPAAVSRMDNININPEMISEILKSPLFQQLITQLAPENRQ